MDDQARAYIKSIGEGNFSASAGSVEFSVSGIDGILEAGNDYDDGFSVYATRGEITFGRVYAHDLRIRVLTSEFSGTESRISYRIIGSMCKPGDVIKGSFDIVTDLGEYYIPYAYTVSETSDDSDAAHEITDMAALAEADWKEAVRIFYSKGCKAAWSDPDFEYAQEYKALSYDNGNEENFDEFLISTERKSALSYYVQVPEIKINISENDAGMIEKEISVLRNGWGYDHFEIILTGDFLFAEKKIYEREDFDGTSAIVKFFVDTSGLGQGTHIGRVIISRRNAGITVPVIVSKKGRSFEAEKQRSRLMYKITRAFVSHRCGQLSGTDWTREASRCIDELLIWDGSDILAHLMHAQLLITLNKFTEATAELDRMAGAIENRLSHADKNDREIMVAYAYHAYLTTLIDEDEKSIAESASRIENLYKRNRDEWRIAWLLLYVPGKAGDNLQARWNLLSDLFDSGCHSPVIYLEGVIAFKKNPTVMQALNGFAVQVAYMAARYGMFTDDMTERLIGLVTKVKDYRPALIAALGYMYEKDPQDRILQEICAQLVRGRRTDATSHEWYRLGIDRSIRITNLYEYFLYSMNPGSSEDIPTAALLYFSISGNLGTTMRAAVYNCMIRKKRELPDIYERNTQAIDRFTSDMIMAGRIDRNLSNIYGEKVTVGKLDRDFAKAFSDIVFSSWLRCDDRSIEKAYVYQKGFKEPFVYTLEDGEGPVCIYGKDYAIALADREGRVYVGSKEYTLEKLLLPGRYIREISAEVWDNLRLNLYLVNDAQIPVDKTNVSRFALLAESDAIEEKLRNEYALRVLEYYAGTDNTTDTDRALARINKATLGGAGKKRLFSALVKIKDLNAAFDMLASYGPYHTDQKALTDLLDEIIGRGLYESLKKDYPDCERILTESAAYAFSKGKMDGITLSFLAERFEGLCRDLKNIWRSASSYGISRTELEGRILTQMICTGAYVGESGNILSDYIASGGEDEIIKAFLYVNAYDAFSHEKIVADIIFREIGKRAEAGEKIPGVVKLAYLYYYSTRPVPSEENDSVIRSNITKFLSSAVEHGIHMGFMQHFDDEYFFRDPGERARIRRILGDMQDKTILDYRTENGGIARIHYRYSDDSGSDSAYRSEYMQEVCRGVYFKEFILFFGERLQYYITEERGEVSELTMSGELKRGDEARGSEVSGRFGLIEDMLISNAMSDYGTFDEMLTDYFRKDNLQKELFRTIRN